MSNLKINSYSWSGNGDMQIALTGDLNVADGKSFTKGTAVFEIKYDDGYVYTHDIAVTDETTGLYGTFSLDNNCYYWRQVGNTYCNRAISTNKASFTVDSTNVTDGTVSLYERGDNTALEVLNITSLTKTVKNDYYYTYKGTFNTTISADKVYEMKFKAADKELSSSTFSYCTEKIAAQDADLNAYNGSCEISLSDYLNISNIKTVTFKAVAGNKTYNIPVTEDYSGNSYINFTADFSSVPVGSFKLKAYDGATEIKLSDTTDGYNYGNISTPVTTGAGHRYVNYTWVPSIYGINLDKVNTATVKVYKSVDFAEDNSSKLQLVKNLTLANPYNAGYISIDGSLLSELEAGEYILVYVLDGKAVEIDEYSVRSTEPTYKASIALNGGIGFTNKTVAELTVSATGYTKMKTAFSKAELETATYEAISATKNINLEGKNGLVTLYVQFANDDESKTEIAETSVTVDTEAPKMEDIVIPSLELWRSIDISFVSNEPLRNAFMLVGKQGASGSIEGRNYIFAYAGTEGGKYKYKCTLYADSQYDGTDTLKTQIAAYDKAGNETLSEIYDFRIEHPKSISGKVTADGKPVANANVHLRNDSNSYVDNVYTNEDGEYTFDYVYKDHYKISVEKRYYKTATLEVLLSELNADVTGKDIELVSAFTNKSTLTVTAVNHKNEPIADAYISVNGWDTGVNTFKKTGADGTASFELPYGDTGTEYSVYISSNGYTKTENITVDSATKSVNFSVPKKVTIKGTALKDETPVPNTKVRITGGNYSDYVETNENGEFTLDAYIDGSNKSFTVSAYNSSCSVKTEVEFGDEDVKDVTLNLIDNIKIKGSLKDDNDKVVSVKPTIRFTGDDLYETVTPDENGEFETSDIFGAGTYRVHVSFNKEYTDVDTNVTITEEDITAGTKVINLISVRRYKQAEFSSDENKIVASSYVISEGDTVTVNVKFKNDGTKTLSNVYAYAVIPDGIDVKTSNGEVNNDTVSKTVKKLKADETGSLLFTLGTDNYNEKYIVIPAYVEANNTIYFIGKITIEIISVTLAAPLEVNKNTPFKIEGTAISGSTVEISNYETKEVLAVTTAANGWFCTDIAGIDKDTTLIAKVSKYGKVAYSDTATVKVVNSPISVNYVKINGSDRSYVNRYLDYPTASVWSGNPFNIAVNFKNIPTDATVDFSYGYNYTSTVKDTDECYSGTLFAGSGTNNVYAIVSTGGMTYKFTVAKITALVDPSGYVTDSETGKPIVGAKVLLEEKSGSNWITWDADPHLQQNPLFTDESGHYGWMVPEGEYRVIVTADGYETKIVEKYDSRDYGNDSKITVLPVRTDVDISLVNARAVELDTSSTASVAGEKIKFVFTRPVTPGTITADNFKVLKSDGTEIAGKMILAENNTVVLFKPSAAMENGSYKLSVSNITDGSGNVIAAEEIPFEKTDSIPALAAPTAVYNTDGTVTITFAEGKTLANSEEIVVKNGTTAVSGTLRTSENIITFIPDSEFTSGTKYTVTISEALRTNANEYLASDFTQDFTPSGSSTPIVNPTPGGGSGGGGVSVASPKASVPGGEVDAGTKVELSTATKDAVIYYTLDGTEPNSQSSVYSEAIVITEDTTIKAVAIKDKTKSSVLTLKYTIKTEDKTDDKKDDNTGISNPTTNVPAFADIANYTWAADAINTLAQKGIVNGVSSTEYAPANNIRRADFMLLLIRMLDLKSDVTDNFDDVPADAYYYEGVGIAKALGLTTGVGDNKFNPEANITRQEMFILAYRILKAQGVELAEADESAINTFDDYASIADYAKEGLASLVKNELIQGSDNKINPAGNATRAETAVFIYRLYNLFNK